MPFFAPLSFKQKGLRKSKADKYNDPHKTYEAAIIGIDAFCGNLLELGAADGVGIYLKKHVAHVTHLMQAGTSKSHLSSAAR
jgi:hypothetical protein